MSADLPPLDDGHDRTAEAGDPPWPLCAQCGRTRLTVCPVCATASDDFPRADGDLSSGQSPGTPPSLGLICSTCDEPFVAQHLRYCPWCGHDEGSGIEIDRRFDAAAAQQEIEAWNGRAVAVAVGLLAVMALLAGYLMTVANLQ